MLINELTEKWSKKYKSSINCSHPKGFSQRAHCQGRKKTNEDANSDLASALTKTQATSYNAIDKLMQQIAKDHNMTAKELHDRWMKKYNETPDDWIKAKLDEGKRQYLDFDKLYGKAFKITDAEGDPNKSGFSIVTPSNTNAWTDWKEKPQFKNIVKQRLNDPNFLGDHKYQQIIVAMGQLSEGPMWDKVKNAATAAAVGGAVGYGALTGQFTGKDQPARAPLEINIPGGDMQQQKPEIKKEKEKLTPSTATNANAEMEQLVFLTAYRAGLKGKELAQFMAQSAHETHGFNKMSEVGSKEYFKKYDPTVNPAKAKILGNVKKGDGVLYRGRGFIQLTGRDNYKRAGKALGIPLEEKPQLAAQPEIAAKVAVWFWKNRVRSEVKDFSDTISVTAKINPSMNGLGDRDMNFQHYLQRLDL